MITLYLKKKLIIYMVNSTIKSLLNANKEFKKRYGKKILKITIIGGIIFGIIFDYLIYTSNSMNDVT